MDRNIVRATILPINLETTATLVLPTIPGLPQVTTTYTIPFIESIEPQIFKAPEPIEDLEDDLQDDEQDDLQPQLQEADPIWTGNDRFITDLSCFDNHTLALDNFGQIFAWGDNSDGKLGNDSVVNENEIILVKALRTDNIVKISAGSSHSMALDGDGRVYCWGNNDYGQLGDGTTYSGFIPILINFPKPIIKITAGKDCSFAIDIDKNVYSWGKKDLVGHNNREDILSPRIIQGLREIYTIVAGLKHCVALGDQVYIWGHNSNGRLGDGTTIDRFTPIALDFFNDKNIIQVAVGRGFSLALESNGDTYQWGQAGPPRLVGNYKAIASGHFHSIGLLQDSRIKTWGLNSFGQLGKGTDHVEFADPDAFIIKIFAGAETSFAIDKDHIVYAWGRGLEGQLGSGSNDNFDHPYNLGKIVDRFEFAEDGLLIGDDPMNQPLEDDLEDELEDDLEDKENYIVSVKLGEYHTVALDLKGNVYSCGNNMNYQLGYDTQDEFYPEMKKIDAINAEITQIAVGENHNLALSTKGKVYGWGNNYNFQISQIALSKTEPIVLQQFNEARMAQIAAGTSHSVALSTTGDIYVWGFNSDVRIIRGLANRFSRIVAGEDFSMVLVDEKCYIWSGANEPRLIEEISRINVLEVVVHYKYFLMKDIQGGIYQWKYENDQVKNFAKVDIDPIPYSSFIAINSSEAFVINSEQQLMSWQHRELSPESTVPSLQFLLDGAYYVSAGGRHCFAKDKYDNVYGWGNNSYGQIGDGTTTNRRLPIDLGKIVEQQNYVPETDDEQIDLYTAVIEDTQTTREPLEETPKDTQLAQDVTIEIDSQIVEVSGGYIHSMARDNYGRVYTWGSNSMIQLGYPEPDFNKTPKIVTELLGKKIIKISAGREHSLALDDEGKVYAWGSNFLGQLGENVQGYYEGIVTVNINKKIVDICAGTSQSLVMDEQGGIYTWGFGKFDIEFIMNVKPETASLACGFDSCGVVNNGMIYMWRGRNSLPKPIQTLSEMSQVQNLEYISQISAKGSDFIAMSFGRNVYQWKYEQGEIRDFVKVNFDDAINVSFVLAGISNSMILAEIERFYYWNPDELYQGRTRPNMIEGFKGAVQGSLGGWHGLVVDTLGYVYTWGVNDFGQLGNGTVLPRETPTRIGNIVENFIKITQPGYLAEIQARYNRMTTEDIDRLTTNLLEGTEDPTTQELDALMQRREYLEAGSPDISEPMHILDLQGGYDNSAFIQGGKLFVWGSPNFAQDIETNHVPTQIKGILENKKIISAALGQKHLLTLDDKGNVYGVGNNEFKQLGDGTFTSSKVPVLARVTKGIEVVQLCVGLNHSVVLDSQGKVYCWGNNKYGQLGDGTRVDKHTPTMVNGLLKDIKVVQIAVGSNATLALSDTRRVYYWGIQDQTEYGGVVSSILSPKLLESLSDVRVEQIATKNLSCSAIDVNGKLYEWEPGFSAQVSSNIVFKQIVQGSNHILGLGLDGKLYAKGKNNLGQLGISHTRPVFNFVEIPNVKNIVLIGCGHQHSLIADDQDNIYTFGGNNEGQLGVGNILKYSAEPIKITGETANPTLVIQETFDCCACYDEKVPEDKLLQCQHALCETCTGRLENPQCPMCRRDLKGGYYTPEIAEEIRKKMRRTQMLNDILNHLHATFVEENQDEEDGGNEINEAAAEYTNAFKIFLEFISEENYENTNQMENIFEDFRHFAHFMSSNDSDISLDDIAKEFIPIGLQLLENEDIDPVEYYMANVHM